MGTGCATSPEIFLHFLTGSGAFWCILGTCFNVSIRRVKVKTAEKQFCAPTGQLSRMADVSLMTSYTQTHTQTQFLYALTSSNINRFASFWATLRIRAVRVSKSK